MECIVLAGGLGTRLKSSIGDYPKCMAPVNDKPFLHYIFTYLAQQNCSRAILSLGYKHDVILDWLQEVKFPFQIDHVVENEALGTGGGIMLAMNEADEETVIVMNGDTLFQIELQTLMSFHQLKQSKTTLALKEMSQFERYGSVNIDEKGCVLSFEEKQYKENGLINGGIYALEKKPFLKRNLPAKFSFEKEYLEAYVAEQSFFGKAFGNYFIDIGIPEDYQKAQEDFKQLFS